MKIKFNKKNLKTFLKTIKVKNAIVYRVSFFDENHGAYFMFHLYKNLWANPDHCSREGHPMLLEENNVKNFFIDIPIKENSDNIIFEQLASAENKFCPQFAFSSLEQLNEWFNEDEKMKMGKENYKIICYKVKKCWNFEKQCLFNKNDIIKKLYSINVK